jgi:hypothetical protein
MRQAVTGSQRWSTAQTFNLIALAVCIGMTYVTSATVLLAQDSKPAATTPATAAAGAPFTEQQLNALLPASVYFSGKSAPVQMRNSGGTRFANGAIVWAAMVDTSGYASGVQEKYQFYFVAEAPIRFGGKLLPAGAYGAGFISGNRFIVMDVGGHTVLEGQTTNDEALKRPRPLQVVPESPASVRLYLGRRWVSLYPAPGL